MNEAFSLRQVRELGVTIPVHNEERRLSGALESLTNALADLDGSRVRRHVAVVLDACRDDSVAIAHSWKQRVERCSHVRVELVQCEFENVGSARALGCEVLLDHCRDAHPSSLWLATTDADSRVPRRWLTAQLDWHKAGVDAWVGRVMINDWHRHRRKTALEWQREYERERRPVHGANLGFVAEQYLAVGGFRPLRTGEDRAIVRALLEDGAAIHFDAETRVATSSRRLARAPGGFASALQIIEASLAFDERAAG